MRKWFQVSLVVELVALLASGAVVAWFLFAGGEGASRLRASIGRLPPLDSKSNASV